MNSSDVTTIPALAVGAFILLTFVVNAILEASLLMTVFFTLSIFGLLLGFVALAIAIGQ